MIIDPLWLFIIFAFLLGSIIGSFLNVCIHRLPRSESIVFPPSHCPSCLQKIAPWDNIPLVSYFILRGRCRHCRERISFVYPLVELLTASSFAFLTWRFGLSLTLLPNLLFLSALIVIFFIDYRHQIIPDAISLPGMILGLAFTPLLPHSFMEGLIGLLGGGLLFYLAALLSRGGMGGGDIKMVAMIGAFLGWKSTAVGVFLALLLGSAVGVFLLATGRKKRKDPIPFGPFLAAGALLALLWGEAILRWYLNLHL